MHEYFVVAVSFPAPLVGDKSFHYTYGRTAEDAMNSFVAEYKHPAGLYSISVYDNADAYHKDITWYLASKTYPEWTLHGV